MFFVIYSGLYLLFWSVFNIAASDLPHSKKAKNWKARKIQKSYIIKMYENMTENK